MITSEILQRLYELIHSRAPRTSTVVAFERANGRLREGTWVRLSRGTYVSGPKWSTLHSSDRHLLQMLAHHKPDMVYSHQTAAALLQLPLFPFAISRTHCVDQHRGAQTSRYVTRHQAPVADRDVVEVAGIRCTNPQRTTRDIVRSAEVRLACGLLDASLRRAERDKPGAGEALRTRLLEGIADSPRARGVAQGRRLLLFADLGAESVLESLARFWFTKFGISVLTQVSMRTRSGRSYRPDFLLEGFNVLAEVDGKSKYRDPRLRNGRSAEEVVIDEKLREDELRSDTQMRFLRLMAEHVLRPEAFRASLLRVGVVPPHPRPRTLTLDEQTAVELYPWRRNVC